MTHVISATSERYAERRKHPRLPCNLSVEVVGMTGATVDAPKLAQVINFSQDGFCLRIGDALPLGAKLSLVVYHNGYDSVCLAEVVWTELRNNSQLCGLRIKHWSYQDRTLQELFQHAA